MAKFCKKCGNQLKDTSKFCSKCGTPYIDEPNVNNGTATANTNQQTASSTQQPTSSIPVQTNKGSEGKGFWHAYFKWGVIISIIMIAYMFFFGDDSGSKKPVDTGGTTVSSAVTNKETAASSNMRDPASSESMDKMFLGKWSGLKPGSQNTKTPNTITITKSNSQTGGYEVELFFYRIANAKGYANIDGNKLSINQGDIMGQKFRGSIEKTNNGIRLTVTESGFQYVKPGSVYEYIK